MKPQKIRVTKKFTFDMAHALSNYDGPCKNIHGHTYHLSVTVLGRVISEVNGSKNGMVIDFTDLKKIVKDNIIQDFDHALVLGKDSPYASLIEFNDSFEKVIFTAYQPSCENLLQDFLHRLKKCITNDVEIIALRLDETPTSYAEWHKSDNI